MQITWKLGLWVKKSFGKLSPSGNSGFANDYWNIMNYVSY